MCFNHDKVSVCYNCYFYSRRKIHFHSEWLCHFLIWLIFMLQLLTWKYIYLFSPSFFQPDEGTSKVRLRLAACRLTQEGETASELPGGRWKISPTRHVSVCVERLVPLSHPLPIIFFFLSERLHTCSVYNEEKLLLPPTGSWISYEENRGGGSRSTWMSSCSTEGDQYLWFFKIHTIVNYFEGSSTRSLE